MKVAWSNLLHEVTMNRNKLSLVRKINLSHTWGDYWMMETCDGTRSGIARGNFSRSTFLLSVRMPSYFHGEFFASFALTDGRCT